MRIGQRKVRRGDHPGEDSLSLARFYLYLLTAEPSAL